jgi:hypothetical protein
MSSQRHHAEVVEHLPPRGILADDILADTARDARHPERLRHSGRRRILDSAEARGADEVDPHDDRTTVVRVLRVRG